MYEKFKAKVVMLKGEAGASGDYNGQTNKPQINGTTLVGNKTSSDLGLASTAQISQLSNRISQVLANNSRNFAGIDMRIYTSDPARMTYDSSLKTYAVAATFSNLPAGYTILEASWAMIAASTYTWSRDGLSVWAHSTNSVSMRITNDVSPAWYYVLRLVVAVSQEIDLSELADLRTGVDGTEYQTAGDAVRGQIEALQEQITDMNNTITNLNSAIQTMQPTVDAFDNRTPEIIEITSDSIDSGIMQNVIANRSFTYIADAFLQNTQIFAKLNGRTELMSLCAYRLEETEGFFSFKYEYTPSSDTPAKRLVMTVTIEMDGTVRGTYEDSIHK